jgi:type II restriction enzyme
MKINLDQKLTSSYKSHSQIARALTESWAKDELFCPMCGGDVDKYANSKPVADFYCRSCREDYELKSKKDSFGAKVVDGAYETMIRRLGESNNPNFFLLNYDVDRWEVQNLFIIPKHFFVPEIIEKRKPLSNLARRAGWVGCKIVLKNIPQSGKIFYIKDKEVKPRKEVLDCWQKTLFLREEKVVQKGWILDVMNCIEKLNKNQFALDEIYSFEVVLQPKYPNNKHIKDKIRQQLQILRDKGYLDFIGKGRYRLVK